MFRAQQERTKVCGKVCRERIRVRSLTPEQRARRSRRPRKRVRTYAVPLICGYCAGCGGSFIATRTQCRWHKKDESPRKYCSRKCQHEHQFAEAKARTDRVCQCCQKTFRTKRVGDGDKYCSRECAFKDWRSWRKPQIANLRRRSIDTPRKMVLRERGVYRRWSAASKSPCAACRELFVRSKGFGDRHCSMECAQRTQADLASRPGASKHCKECGIWFSGLLGFRRMEYCSDGCRDISQSRYRRVAKSKDKAVRRARERFNGPYVAIDPIVVFERDGWACRYCGCDTPRALRGTYDGNAP